MIRCLGRIKAAAARVNAELGLLDHDLAERIAADDDAVAEGEHDDRSTSSRPAPGTSSNTNANEVIAGWG